MAESIELKRRAAIRLAGRGVGLKPEQPRFFQSQQYGAGREADILAFPSQPSPNSIQIAGTGGFRFMLGLSALGGADTL